jgi:hypothetical protein
MCTIDINILFDIYNDQVKKNEMGRACSTNGREEEFIQDICGKARWKETIGKTKA